MPPGAVSPLLSPAISPSPSSKPPAGPRAEHDVTVIARDIEHEREYNRLECAQALVQVREGEAALHPTRTAGSAEGAERNCQTGGKGRGPRVRRRICAGRFGVFSPRSR